MSTDRERRDRTTRVFLVLGSEVRPVLIRWCTWQPPSQREGHNDSYALVTDDGSVLVDHLLQSRERTLSD